MRMALLAQLKDLIPIAKALDGFALCSKCKTNPASQIKNQHKTVWSGKENLVLIFEWLESGEVFVILPSPNRLYLRSKLCIASRPHPTILSTLFCLCWFSTKVFCSENFCLSSCAAKLFRNSRTFREKSFLSRWKLRRKFLQMFGRKWKDCLVSDWGGSTSVHKWASCESQSSTN